MKVIDTPAALAAITDLPLDRFAELMELATIFIVEPGDTLVALESARGLPFEVWEYIEAHPDGWFEAVFVLSDDGAGHVVLVPDRPCIDAELLSLCRANATKPDDMIEF